MWIHQVRVPHTPSPAAFPYLDTTSKIFPDQSTESFHAAVRSHILSDLDGLDPTAVLTVKKLLAVAEAEANNPDAANIRESYAQAERMASGIPGERFAKIARKEIRHKL